MMKQTIAVIGSGSVFTPELVSLLAHEKNIFMGTKLQFYDTDPMRQEIVAGFCGRLIVAANSDLEITCHDSVESCVHGADFVLLQLRQGGQKLRIEDEKLGRKYRIPFVETVSVCGFSTFLRTYYEFEILASIIKRQAPGAWVLNFTNPTGQLTETLAGMGIEKVVGVCNSWIGAKHQLAALAGVDPQTLFLHWRGLNHLTVVDRATDMSGRDILPEILRSLPDKGITMSFENSLLKSLGSIPNSYVQYYFHSKKMIDKLHSTEKLRSEEVLNINNELLETYRTANTLPEKLKQRGGYGYSHAVVGIIKSMCQNDGGHHAAVVRNNGCISFLPIDAYIESVCVVYSDGIYPLCMPPVPEYIRALMFGVKIYEASAICGAKERSKDLLLRSLMAHPLLNDYGIAEPLLDDCLEINRDYLPKIT